VNAAPLLAVLLVGFVLPTALYGQSNATETLAAVRPFGRTSRPVAFKEVVWATTSHRILDVDTNSAAHRELLHRLREAAALAMDRASLEGIRTARANEAGNQMEKFVRDALRSAGLDVRVPVNTAGRAQAAGYPDLEITDTIPAYLELKTFSAATADTTQRSFYYSPVESPKITRDALHLLLAFQMERTEEDATAVFRPVRWKLLTLQDLQVELKLEFNQSNRGLYGTGAAGAQLGEGTAGRAF
jgi:hypothetical protein